MSVSSAKLVTQLADKIQARIVSGEYPPGTRLKQDSLAAEFSVSRTPIREALRQLEVKGNIHHVPNQGASVPVPNAREIREAYQVRAELEGLAAALSVRWITDEQIESLKAAQARFAEAVRLLTPRPERPPATNSRGHASPNWVEVNEDFHSVILEAAGNRRLAKVVHDQHVGFARNLMLAARAMDGRQMRENVAQHEAILDAIEQQDADEARRAMTHHIMRSGELLVRWLESRGKL